MNAPFDPGSDPGSESTAVPGALATLRGAWRREWAYLRGSGVTFAVYTWIPLAVCVVVLATFWQGLPRDLPVAVVDLDRSALSQRLVRQVDATPTVRVAVQAGDLAAAQQALRRRQVFGILYIPPHLERDVTGGHRGAVQYLSNAQFSTASGMIAHDVQAAVGTLSAQAKALARIKRGESALAVSESVPLVDFKTIALYNGALDYEMFLSGALIPALLQVLIVIAAVAALGREMRDRTLPQWLAPLPRPAHPWAALCGKLLPAFLVFTAWGLAFLCGFALLRHHPVNGSALMLAFGMVAFVAAHLAFGAAIAAVVGNMRMALSVAAFIAGPAFAFGGQTFPLMGLSGFARVWSACLPLTYWLELQNQQWLMASPWTVSLRPLLVLLLFLALCGGIARVALVRVAARPQDWGRR